MNIKPHCYAELELEMIGEIRITQNCYDPANNNQEVEVLTEWNNITVANDNLNVLRCQVKFLDGRPSDGWPLYLQKHQLKKLSNGNDASSWDQCIWQPQELHTFTDKHKP